MTKKMRAAIYARTSTARDQDPEVQLAELRPFVERRGWALDQKHVYVDFGYSGARDSRPALDQMLAAARQRKFDVIVLWSLCRLGRSLRTLIVTCEELGALGIDLVSYTQPIDTTTAAGKLTFAVLAACAEFERSLTKDRIRAGIAKARASGKRLGRPPIDLDPEQLRARLAAGESIRGIARLMGTSHTSIRRALARGGTEGALAAAVS